jgi:transposase
MSEKRDPEQVVREIERKTRRKYTAEDENRIVLEGLRGGEGIAGLCRGEGIRPDHDRNRSEEFLEAGERLLSGDCKRQATNSEVVSPKREILAARQRPKTLISAAKRVL